MVELTPDERQRAERLNLGMRVRDSVVGFAILVGVVLGLGFLVWVLSGGSDGHL